MFDITKLLRPNIRQLAPYSSARDDFKGDATTWLDANENCVETAYNRYPDPYQKQLKAELANYRQVAAENIFLGNGSDEAIDLLYRAFCRPGKDKVIIMPPTYGMYHVSAAINDVEVIEVPLCKDWQPDMAQLSAHWETADIKLLFCCSPNNPTGNVVAPDKLLQLTKQFKGLVVVDEAYIDFCPEHSALHLLQNTPNLVVLQTFSKAWGLAGLRLGAAYANSAIIEVMNKIKPPYNVNAFTQQKVLQHLQQESRQVQQYRDMIAEERQRLVKALRQLPAVVKVYDSEANFVLVQFKQHETVYNQLADKGIIVRNRHGQVPGTLRITVGTPTDNEQLMTALKNISTHG